MKLTRTRLLPIVLLTLFVVAMIGSCAMLISCKDEEDPYFYKGEFYTLQEAYDNGYLTYDDLKEIAKMKSKELEDERLKKSIMNTYVNKLKKHTNGNGVFLQPNATMNDVWVEYYYGTYNGSVVVRMADMFYEYPQCYYEHVVGGVVIGYTPPEPVVWRKINQ